jgi:hypothetical protein
MVRDLLRRCIHLARQSKRNRNDEDFYEALRLLGTANHCMEGMLIVVDFTCTSTDSI